MSSELAAVQCEKRRFRRQNKIKIMFCRLKGWRQIAS
jgi:hypothetical protein